MLEGLSAGAVLCLTTQGSITSYLLGLLLVTRSSYVNLRLWVASMLDPIKLSHLQNLTLTEEPRTRILFQTRASGIHVTSSYFMTVLNIIEQVETRARKTYDIYGNRQVLLLCTHPWVGLVFAYRNDNVRSTPRTGDRINRSDPFGRATRSGWTPR